MARLGTYQTRVPAVGEVGFDPDEPLPVSGAIRSALANPVAASNELIGITAAATLIADTGALVAGTYRVEISLGFSGTLVAGKHITVQHRDAANAANIHRLGLCPGGSSMQHVLERVVIATNERIRAVTGAVATLANEVVSASIRAYLIQ